MSVRMSVTRPGGPAASRLAHVQLAAQTAALARNACPPGWARQSLRVLNESTGEWCEGQGASCPPAMGIHLQGWSHGPSSGDSRLTVLSSGSHASLSSSPRLVLAVGTDPGQTVCVVAQASFPG